MGSNRIKLFMQLYKENKKKSDRIYNKKFTCILILIALVEAIVLYILNLTDDIYVTIIPAIIDLIFIDWWTERHNEKY